jgi:hypothetical protein
VVRLSSWSCADGGRVVVEIWESLITTEGVEVVAALLLVSLEMVRHEGVIALGSCEPHSSAKSAYEWGTRMWFVGGPPALEMARHEGVVDLGTREPHSSAKNAYEWGTRCEDFYGFHEDYDFRTRRCSRSFFGR